MPRSPLFGRRVHIAGSIADDPIVATTEAVDQARGLVALLVKDLVKCGANFVVSVDAEPTRESDGRPVCFDWLVWKTLKENLARRPAGLSGPFVVAVQHHKSEDQIPPQYVDLWDELRDSSWGANRKCRTLEHEQQANGGTGPLWRHPRAARRLGGRPLPGQSLSRRWQADRTAQSPALS